MCCEFLHLAALLWRTPPCTQVTDLELFSTRNTWKELPTGCLQFLCEHSLWNQICKLRPLPLNWNCVWRPPETSNKALFIKILQECLVVGFRIFYSPLLPGSIPLLCGQVGIGQWNSRLQNAAVSRSREGDGKKVWETTNKLTNTVFGNLYDY